MEEIDMTYEHAVILRAQAETAQDPSLFERAARAFDALEMPAAASRCRERAEYYKAVYA